MHAWYCFWTSNTFSLALVDLPTIFAMVQFKDVGELRAHLLGWEAVYGEYAEVLWEEGGIRSSEMIAGYSPEVYHNLLYVLFYTVYYCIT